MGELSFTYETNPWRRIVHSVSYKHNPSTEYGLSFQRYAALFDASIFNSPVVISKVATGLSAHSDVESLFADKKAAPITDINALFDVNPPDRDVDVIKEDYSKWTKDIDFDTVSNMMVKTQLPEEYGTYFYRFLMKDKLQGHPVSDEKEIIMYDGNDGRTIDQSLNQLFIANADVHHIFLPSIFFVNTFNTATYIPVNAFGKEAIHHVNIHDDICAAPIVEYKIANWNEMIFAMPFLSWQLSTYENVLSRIPYKHGIRNNDINTKKPDGNYYLNIAQGIHTYKEHEDGYVFGHMFGSQYGKAISVFGFDAAEKDNEELNIDHQLFDVAPHMDGYINVIPQLSGEKEDGTLSILQSYTAKKSFMNSILFENVLAYAYPYERQTNFSYQIFGKLVNDPYLMHTQDIVSGIEVGTSMDVSYQVFGNVYNKKLDSIENILTRTGGKIFDVINQTSGTLSQKSFIIQEILQVNGQSLNDGLHIFKQLNAESKQKISNIFRFVSATGESKSLSAFSVLSAIGGKQYSQVLTDITHAMSDGKEASLPDSVHASVQEVACSISEILHGNGIAKQFNILDNFLAKTYGQEFDIGDFLSAITQRKALLILENILSENGQKKSDMSYDIQFGLDSKIHVGSIDSIFASKDIKTGYIYQSFCGGSNGNQSFNDFGIDSVIQNGQLFSIFNMFNHELMNTIKSGVNMNPKTYEQVLIEDGKNNRPANIFEYNLSTHKTEKNGNRYTPISFIDKTSDGYSILDTTVMNSKTSTDINILDTTTMMSKTSTNSNTLDTTATISKTSTTSSVLDTTEMISKTNTGSSVLDTTAMMFKTSIDANWYENPFNAFKSEVITSIIPQAWFLDKISSNMSVFNGVQLYRKAVSMVTHCNYTLSRLAYEMSEMSHLWLGNTSREAFESHGVLSSIFDREFDITHVDAAKKTPSTVERLQVGAYSHKYPKEASRVGIFSLSIEQKNIIRYEYDTMLSSLGRDMTKFYQLLLNTKQKSVDRYTWLNFSKINSMTLRRFNKHVSAKKTVKKVVRDDVVSLGKHNKLMDCLNQLFMDIVDKKAVRYENLFTDVVHERQPKDGSIRMSLFEELFLSYPNDNLSLYHEDANDSVDAMALKLGGSLIIWEKLSFANKKQHNMYLALKSDMISKIKYSMCLRDDISITRRDPDIYLELKDLWLCRYSNTMEIMPWAINVAKDKYMMDVYKNIHAYKGVRSIPATIDINTAFKNIAAATTYGDYGNPLWENIGGAFIPIFKGRHQGFIDSITSAVRSASPGSLFINKNIFSSVIPHDSNLNIDIFLDKIPFKTWIEYENEMIAKNTLHTSVHNDSVIFLKQSGNRDMTVWETTIGDVHKLGHPTNITTQLFMERESHHTRWTPPTTWVDRESRPVSDEDNYLAIQRLDRITGYLNQIYLERIPRLCYYDYGYGEWTHRKNYPTLVDVRDEWSDRKDYDTRVFDFMTPSIRKNVPTFYEECMIPGKFFRDIELANQLDWMNKTRAKCGIHPHDFGNWAWVYETPDPFQQNLFGIDELLLPENDTRYEDFEDLIFDKKYMRPRSPVKIIDDTTFIAKFPSKHPIKKFKDIGLDYDSGALKLQNYFGVETDVMHSMFLRFYRIWQSKVFQFATMTMQQAVNQMLEYLFAWIPDYYPVDKVEQAYRVLRLIRWYGEAAIIRNSQYIVTYELDTLQTTMNNGHCEVPHNLQCENPDSTNDSMFIDSSMRVIRNDPTQLGTDAYVELYIDNKRNTTISFSLANTIGSVYIYLNDNLIDVQSRSALNLVYSIPFTGDTNVIKIEKPAAHNLNDVFYIGNIRVEKMSYKNLNVEFDPQLKAGNKPLNEIAIKIVQYANLKEDRDKAYKEALKSNLGLSEMYKKLLEYWNLHHQNKIKGKRLTIKEI